MTAITLAAPLAGCAMPLTEVPDPAFAQGLVGTGMAIDPTVNELRSPCDGVVLSVHRARHACTVRTASGAEVLLHLGVDTVGLNGEGFTAHVQDGQSVKTGDRLANRVEIRSGLNPGDRVVVSGQLKLANGAAVVEAQSNPLTPPQTLPQN